MATISMTTISMTTTTTISHRASATSSITHRRIRVRHTKASKRTIRRIRSARMLHRICLGEFGFHFGFQG
jgi:hypothetical protein